MTLLKAELLSKTDNFLIFKVDNNVVHLTKEEFLKAIDELHVWQYAHSGCFHSQLYRLIAKADDNNMLSLFKGFPHEVVAYLLWFHKSESDSEFFRNFGGVAS